MNLNTFLKGVLLLPLLVALSILNTSAQSMGWVYLEGGQVNGSCTSTSDCDNNEICYGLVYTPAVSGVITSYTTGFFIDCVPAGVPVSSSTSCIMTTNTNITDACVTDNLILIAASGNSGTSNIMAGQPITLHQVCFTLAENESVNIVEDDITDLTTSIDLSGGGAITEFPAYTTFVADHNTPCAALAVRFASFDLTAKEGSVWLNWTTTNEINNDYFSIEWSEDGREFKEIGQLVGAGNSTERIAYQFEHTKPANGTNYYRIKTVEFDGAIDYSVIRSIRFNTNNKEPIDGVFPNPAKDFLTIKMNQSVLNEPFTIQVKNMTGQLMMETHIETTKTAVELSLKGLQAGTYALIFENQQEQYVKRFVKL